LLEDQGFVVVAQAGAAGEGDAAFVFFGLGGCGLGGAAEVVDLRGLLEKGFPSSGIFTYFVDIRGEIWDGSLQVVNGIPSLRVLQADDSGCCYTPRRQRREG
jgi:hypothetical protein